MFSVRWFVVAGLALVAACSSDSAPEMPAPAPAPEVATSTGQAATPPKASPEQVDPAIVAELNALKSRQACNRITGCSAMAGLMRHGAALIEPARQALASRGADGHWPLALIEALGQLELTEASPVLAPFLKDKRWEIQLAAARGLAYLGSRMDDAAVATLVEVRRSEPLDTPASRVRAALIEHALMRSGRDPLASSRKGSARDGLIALLPAPEPYLTPHPQLDAFVRLIGEARIPEGLPLVRVALHSRNRLVTATALDVAGALQDTGAIPYALSLLEDGNPTLRKEAIRALQRITGSRQLDQPDQWREWAKTHNAAPLPLPPALDPGPQVLEAP